METVKVIVNIPGLLEIGDILTSAGEGEDFTMFVKEGNFERSATIDYYSVCANIPTYFTWVLDENETFEAPALFVAKRSIDEVSDRRDFFMKKAVEARTWEESTVYHNLVWFIDWLEGTAELIKE
jgi:hypothetical protein